MILLSLATFHDRLTTGLAPASDDFAVELIDRLLPLLIESGASDLHLQPTATGIRLWIRIDGVLSLLGDLPSGTTSNPVSRLMVLAGLPTYRSTMPMEGRLKWANRGPNKEANKEASLLKDSENQVSMRLGFFPTVHGVRSVIRVLRREVTFDSMTSLGMTEEVTEQLESLCHETDGVILLTGPAGSGKTTTLYTMLQCIASLTPSRSVLTIEDPVETVLAGISQSEIDSSTGMTLASALRSAVRQDSEVLLVSEIRDPETVQAAMQASLTGHLVFSSLHATDVATALRRLAAYEVPAHVIRSGLRAVINQRLVRRLCPECKAGCMAGSSHDCVTCTGTGYRGRLPITQCVDFQKHSPGGASTVGEVLAEGLEAGKTVRQMNAAADAAGGRSLRDQARHGVDSGVTDQAEVYRVLGRG